MKLAISWLLRIVPALIIGQTLPFKFSGHAQSKELFTTLTENAFGNGGLEAAARLGTGGLELIAVVLLLIPKLSKLGALLTIGLMFGALASHTLFIGFGGANGQLAAMAGVSLISAALYLVKSMKQNTLALAA